MKNKRNYLLVAIAIFIVIGIFFVGEYGWKKINDKDNKIDMDIDTNINLPQDQIEFIQSLIDLESKNMKILDNPLRIEGEFYIPEETILSYTNHYLKDSNNKDIENIQVIINENKLTVGGEYKLFAGFKTPIDIDIEPILTTNKNLKLKLKDIRVLNLSLHDDIIDAIAKSWFSQLDNISVDKGDIIIDKKFFKNINIKNIEVKKDHLKIELIIMLK